MMCRRWREVVRCTAGGQVHCRWSGAGGLMRGEVGAREVVRCAGGGQVRSRWFDVQQVVRCVAGGQVQVV